MSYDRVKAKGVPKSTKPDSGGAAVYATPLIGTVMQNVDKNKSGRIQVYLSGINTKPKDDPTSWTTVSFLSPYGGSVSGDAGNAGYGDFKGNPASYGMWNSPPDIGSQVLCMFHNGDPNYGYYVGVIPNPDTLHMVPHIGAIDNVIPNQGEADSYGGAPRLPVTNINSNNADLSNSPDFLTAPKPVHSYAASLMQQQGTLRDPIRGPISTSAQRESPSNVGFGVNSPGEPIYQNGMTKAEAAKAIAEGSINPDDLTVVSRKQGHVFIMDDGDLIGRDQLIRIKTGLGHLINLSDDGQVITILHANGQTYIELGKEGTVDIYSTNSVNVRTHGDLNFHADNNINMHTNKNFNLQADTFNINVDNNMNQRVGSDYQVSAGGKFTLLAGGALSLAAGGDASMAASGISYVNGSKVNLNSGQTGTVPAAVQNIPPKPQVDTVFDKQKGFLAAPGKLLTICSRAPAHVPWDNANKGVDVNVNLSADAAFADSPSASVNNVNQTAQGS